MLNRRNFIGTIPVTALAITSSRFAHGDSAVPNASDSRNNRNLIASPPVVQNPRSSSFGVSFAVSGLCTAWVEYGFKPDDLKFTAIASHHGLISADDQVIHIRVNHADPFPAGQPIFYRILAQPLAYKNAYKLERGDPQATDVHELRLPSASMDKVRIVSINDSHENSETIQALHQEIEKLNPDVLVWNGDTCNDFDSKDAPEQILLNPGKDLGKAWASTRPLLFSNGNHDVRGQRAREAAKCFVGSPESSELPYNQALRFGPLAIVTLDTGEDKPDRHPVFAGTAAFEPYRKSQSRWLKQIVSLPQIKDAPFKIVTSHIPLRGLEGQTDGTTLDGYAKFSGFGEKFWLPTLIESGFQTILSGHTHRHRLDPATEKIPIVQVVGGGPKPEQATLTIVDASQTNESKKLVVRVVALSGKVLLEQRW